MRHAANWKKQSYRENPSHALPPERAQLNLYVDPNPTPNPKPLTPKPAPFAERANTPEESKQV